jgi:signal transduction histidine kinase
LAGGFGGLLSRVFLARPLARLLEGIRAVRSGTTLQPLPEEGDFEVASLATEFNQMTRDLAAAREAVVQESEARRVAQQALQAADRLVTVGQLSAALAHEIGSPLQVLHGRARALAERPMEPAQVQANAQILVRESERISRIVSQTLSLARRRPLRRIRFDLSAVAREVAHVMESEARRRRIHLERAWDPEAVEMMGDPDQLQQVALNLLLNALHATPPGGHVRIGTRQGTSQAILFVEDDGEGMDEETATRAFEPLFTTHAEQGGTGLGLAVVKALVEEHGGRVTLRTEKGRGSLFSIEIPTPGEEPA